MRSFLVKILWALILVDLTLFLWRVCKRQDGLRVLGLVVFTSPTPIATLTPAPTLTPIPTSTPTPIPTPLPTLTPTPTQVPQPEFSGEEIHGFIERFAVQYSCDPNVLRHIAVCESGFRADAVNGPYAGLFQFAVATWKSHRNLMGEDGDPDLRFNAEESVRTAAYTLSQGKGHIWPNCYP